MTKSNEQKLEDLKKVETLAEKAFPEYTWEDLAMWTQLPNNDLGGKSPLQICADEDISSLVKYLEGKIK